MPPVMEMLNRHLMQARRRALNPSDMTTIVSIAPFDINEVKHTLEPGKWHIPKGSYDNPSVVAIGTSSWWMTADPEKPPVEVPVGSYEVAESVIKDYCASLHKVSWGASQPGVFILPGNISPTTVKKEHKALLDTALAQQRAWYLLLTQDADMLWARTNGNPIAIGVLARIAAQELGLKDKPWMQDFSTIEKKACIACGTFLNPAFPICPNCKAINGDLGTLNIKFAG